MSAPGFIKHNMSSKFIHPESDGTDSPNDDPLVVFSGGFPENRIQFRFVPVEGEGHFGYIEHTRSGKIVHPESGLNEPGNDTKLVLHSDRHVGALFKYDSLLQNFVHKSGNIWHPYGGRNIPDDGTLAVLHEGVHEAARFHLVDSNHKEIDVYPTPRLFGSWKLVFCVINPQATQTHKHKYTVGTEASTSKTTRHAWKVSAEVSFNWFKSSASYSGFAEKTDSSTWKETTEKEDDIVIEKGPTVAVWQWNFGANQYNQQKIFESTIFKHTSDPKNPPPEI